MESSDPKSRAAAKWYGYGRWSAPFWFIGKEPGGADDPEQYASWVRLGEYDLIDCREHDLDCAGSRPSGLWHGGGSPPLQTTWRLLIAMTLAYQGAAEYDADSVRRYQDDRWGITDGDTAVLELSAVAARSVIEAEAQRLMHLPNRIERLRREIAANTPEFVVFYGVGIDPVNHVPYLDHWNAIAQAELAIDKPQLIGRTVFVVQRHPTAHGTTTEHWVELGHRLRALTEHHGPD